MASAVPSYFYVGCLIIWILRFKNQDKHFAPREFFTNQHPPYLIDLLIDWLFNEAALTDPLNFNFRHYNLLDILTRYLNKYFSFKVIEP